MTICIAAIGKDDKGNEIVVFATDHMVSNPQIGSFEKTIDKFKKINRNTVAMLSGDPLIFEDLIQECRQKKCSFDEMAKLIETNMNTLKDAIIQKQILDIFKINYDYIKDILKGTVNNAYIDNVLRTISKFNLGTLILLIGFKEGEAQISEISENRLVSLRDIEFGAIGTGAVQALNTLLFQRHSKNDPLTVTLYNVYKAKRNAEVAIGVGKETDILILKNEGIMEIPDEKIKILSDIYEDELKFGKTNEKLNEVVKDIKVE